MEVLNGLNEYSTGIVRYCRTSKFWGVRL